MSQSPSEPARNLHSPAIAPSPVLAVDLNSESAEHQEAASRSWAPDSDSPADPLIYTTPFPIPWSPLAAPPPPPSSPLAPTLGAHWHPPAAPPLLPLAGPQALPLSTTRATATLLALPVNPLEGPLAGPSRRLDSLTAAEVYAIDTPRNPRTLHQLPAHSAIATELSNSNSPRSWRLCHTLDKIRNCGSSALHERDFLQDRLRLHHQHDSETNPGPMRNPRYRQRQQIPSEGLAFRNKDEINAHFAARDAADKARMEERASRAKERMTKLQ